jgi:hypothetical protein
VTSMPRPQLPRCPACGVSWSDENDHLDGELLCHSCDELEQHRHTCTACSTHGSDQLEAALHYAARGWHVLPTRLEDKAPRTDLVRRGHLDATTDTDQLMEWWGPDGTALDSGVSGATSSPRCRISCAALEAPTTTCAASQAPHTEARRPLAWT